MWLNRKDDDLFGISDPRVHTTIKTEEKSEKREQLYTDQRGKRISTVIKDMTSLEITKRGHVLSDKELYSIRKKKVAHRQKKKKERQRAFKEKDKAIAKFRRSDKSPPPKKNGKTSTSEWKKTMAKRKQRIAAKEAKKSYTREQRDDFRRMKQREKAHKKRKKKARQAARKEEAGKIITEAKVDVLPVVDSFLYSYEAGEFNRSFDNTISLSTEYLERFKHHIGEHKDLLAVVLYIHQMVLSESFAMDLSITSSFSLLFSDVDLSTGFGSLGCVFNYLKRRKRKPQCEAWSEYMDGAIDYAKIVLDGQLVTTLRNIVLIAVSWKLFSVDNSKAIRKVFGKMDSSLTLPAAVIVILEAVSFMIRSAEHIVNGGKISSLIFSNNPITVAMREAQAILKYENSLYFGLPDETRMCAKQYMSKTGDYLQILEASKGCKNPMSKEYYLLQDVISRLKSSRHGVRNALERKVRTPPIGVVIHGPPGIGKSSVTNFVYQLHSHVKGRIFCQTHVFERVMSSQYWDGYDPYSTPYIHYSEVGSTAKHIVKNKGDDVVRELTSVCDSLPYTCDMSDVKDKGKVNCLAEMVVIDTNLPDMNISATVRNPTAYERRFIYIEPVVKKEFRLEGSSALDPESKSDNYYDKWNFRVVTKVPITLEKSREVVHLQGNCGDNIHALERVLTELFSNAIEVGERNREQREFSYFEHETEARILNGSIDPQIREHWCNMLAFMSIVLGKLGTDALSCTQLTWNYFALWLFDTYFSTPKIVFFGPLGLFASVMWMKGMLGVFMICMLFALLSVDIKEVTKTIIRRKMNHTHNHLKVRAKSFAASCKSTLLACFGKDFEMAPYYGSILLGISALIAVIRIFYPEKEKEKFHTESSSFRLETAHSEDLKKMEDDYNCGDSYKRMPIKGQTKVWNTMVLEPSKHKGSLADLHSFVMRNARRCVVITPQRTYSTYCLGVQGSFALINRHALGLMESNVILKICVKGNFAEEDKHFAYHECEVRKADLVFVCNDVVLIDVDGISFKNIVKHFPLEDVPFRLARAMIGRDNTHADWHAESLIADDQICGEVVFGSVITYKWNAHDRGMCGLPLVAQRDSGSCVLGVHSAGTKGYGQSFAAVVLRSDLERAIDLLRNKTLAPILSESAILYGVSPHPKSPVNYEDLGAISYYGAVSQPLMRQKSSLVPSIFREDLDVFFFDTLNHVRSIVYDKPLMQPVGSGASFRSPYNLALRKLSRSKKTLSRGRIYRAVDIAYAQISENLSKRDIPKLAPLTVEAAMNGVEHDAFIRRMDMRKAAGFGTPGAKSDYCIRYASVATTYDEPNDEIQAQILEIIACYKRGDMYGPVFKAQLKDEPRDIEKVAVGKTRVFYATPFAFLIVQRMFLSPFYSLMVEFGEDFYTAIGIDMHRNGHSIYHRLKNFSELILEGDYGSYDQSMNYLFGRAANTIVLRLLADFGYDAEQLGIVAGLLSDNMFPFVEMIGEMMCIPGMQPSGKFATAEDNSMRNLLIMIYLWLSMEGNEEINFFDQVLPVSYGDDLLAAVKEDSKHFNALSFKKLCEEETDLTFTSATKGEIVTKFVSPEEMTFLKRTFRFHSRLGKIVAPISLDSLYKTLEWLLPSKVANEESQYEMIINSVLRELYLHDNEEAFAEFSGFLNKRFNDRFGVQPRLTTFNEVEESLQVCSDSIAVSEGGRHDSLQVITESGWDFTQEELSGFINGQNPDTDTVYAFGRAYDVTQWSANKIPIIENQISLMEEELKEITIKIQGVSNPMPGMNYRQVKRTKEYAESLSFRDVCDDYFHQVMQKEALEASIHRLWSWLQREKSSVQIVTESRVVSEMTDGIVPSSNLDTHQNVADVGGDAKDDNTAGEEKTLDVGQKGMLDMGDFLSRPLSLANVSYTAGSDLTYSLDIWDAFLSHPSVRAKIRNYAYLKANLVVRIAVSGTPFHYGKLQVSYQPLASMNKNLPYVESLLGTANRIGALTYLSQAPGCSVIDVKSNKPLELSLPFISPQPVMRLFNDSPLILPDSSSFDDSVGFGKLYINSINTLSAASSTPTPVSLFIYAYMTDLQLGAPTGTVITIGTEADVDERKTGPVERFATRASEIAYALTSVPIIAPFAKASAMTLEGVGALSALFGYSVPTMETEPERVKNEPFQNGAHMIGYDTGKRLVLDPCQELSVDPRVTGTEDDDMAIAALCKKESLLDVFDWGDSDNPLSNPVWTAPVNPRIMKRLATGAPTPYVVAPTPLSFAATPFEYWRGDITFRFEIVCSAYHRGKLAFYFEPNIAQNVVIDTVLDMNKQYVKVIDIQETQDVSFCVKWAFPKAWARVLPDSLLGDLGEVGFLGTGLFDYANGYIAVTPFTKLQSPDGSDIQINVYVSSENMMFNQLVLRNFPTIRPTTEARVISTPTDVACMDLNESTANVAHISEEHFGEMPVSFRALCKRFCGYEHMTSESIPAGAGVYGLLRKSLYPAPNPGYTGTASSAEPNLISYLRYGYVAMRGGTKHRVTINGGVTFNETSRIKVKLRPPSSSFSDSMTKETNVQRLCSSIIGTLDYIPHTNGGVEFEVPFYSNNLFAVSFSDDFLPTTESLIDDVATRGFEVIFPWTSIDDVDNYIVHDIAAAEDFSLMRYQGAPLYQLV